MKRILSLIISAALVFSLAACASNEKAFDPTEDILSTFSDLARIPRPSHHEEQISDYLMNWAESLGLAVQQDDLWNLIIDVPATKGMENKPLVALQGHMDMVFAQASGSNLDPITTEIRIVNDGTYLTSDHMTSLGADDGIGLAIMMNIAEGKMPHGPLRLIITTDEEDGMDGAFGLDPIHLSDVQYLINLDSEEEGTMCLSTAAAVSENFRLPLSRAGSAMDAGICVRLQNLRGGHSGLDIGYGRLNAISALAEMLAALDSASIEYELSSFAGGTAPNAIPSEASAVICVSAENSSDACALLSRAGDSIRVRYAGTDPDMSVSVEDCDVPGSVLSSDCKNVILAFVGGVTNGVVSMSEDIDGLVESSSNLGTVKTEADEFTALSYVRSSSPDRLSDILADDKSLSQDLGLTYFSVKSADPWPYNPDSRLAEIADEAYMTLFNEELEHITIHAAIECGTFSTYNPALDMIALGPTLRDVHTTGESLEIASIASVWQLVELILANV